MYQTAKSKRSHLDAKKDLSRVKSQGKQSFSMNLGHSEKIPQIQGFSLCTDKKINKVDVNKIQTKIGKCLQKHKSRIEKTKQLIRLQRFRAPTNNKNHTSSTNSLKQQKELNEESFKSLRDKDCYILQKGHMKKISKSEKVSANNSLAKLQESPKTPKKVQENKLPQNWNKQLLKIQKLTQSVSTDDSRSSIKQPKFTDFVIGRKLGQGKYGKVYLAKHKKSGMMVALKKMYKNRIDFYAKRQMIEEIKIQYYINHPNVIKLYSFFEDQDSVFLVIELFISGHLFSYLQKKKTVEERLTKSIVKQICQGLKHLHANNIIHRDIKLQNILFQMGMVKICDFGWSIETEQFRETFCGTPLYLSPQILQQKGYDNKIDVWSVGILTYELIFGKVPFEINSQLDFAKIVYEEVKFPQQKQISPLAMNFIQLCLQKDPSLRPTTQELLTHAFLRQVDDYQGSQIF